ncbi:MAG: DinB family protein [Anaerolineae bacterium]
MVSETVLGWQFTQLSNNIKSVESIVRMTDPQALTTYRDTGIGWTALQVLCHLRDFEQVFTDRAHIAVEQENATLPFPSPDDLARDRHYNEQSVDAVLAEWKTRRADFIVYLRERSAADWERTALHPTRGILTLLEQLFLATLHDTTHLEQMTRILNEKRLS